MGEIIDALESDGGYEVTMGVEPCLLSYDSEDKLGGIMNCKATITLLSQEDGIFQHLYSSKGRDIRLNVFRHRIGEREQPWLPPITFIEHVWTGTLDPESYEEPYIRENNYIVRLSFSDFSPLKRVKHTFEGLVSIKDIVKSCVNQITVPSLSEAQCWRPDYLFQAKEELNGDSIIEALGGSKSLMVDSKLFGRGEDAMSLYDILSGTLRSFSLSLVQREGSFVVANVYQLSDLSGALRRAELKARGVDGMLLTDIVYRGARLELKQNMDFLQHTVKHPKLEKSSLFVEFPTADNESILSHRLYFKQLDVGNPYIHHCRLEPVSKGEEQNFVALYLDFRQTQGVYQEERIYPSNNGFVYVPTSSDNGEFVKAVIPDSSTENPHLSNMRTLELSREGGAYRGIKEEDNKEGFHYGTYYGQGSLWHLFAKHSISYPFEQKLSTVGQVDWYCSPCYANPKNLATGKTIGFCTDDRSLLDPLGFMETEVPKELSRLLGYGSATARVLDSGRVNILPNSLIAVNLKLFVALGHNFVEELQVETHSIIDGVSAGSRFSPSYLLYPEQKALKETRAKNWKCRQATVSFDIYAYPRDKTKKVLHLSETIEGQAGLTTEQKRKLWRVYAGYKWQDKDGEWNTPSLPYGFKQFSYNQWMEVEPVFLRYPYSATKEALDNAEGSVKSPFENVGLVLPAPPDGYDEVRVVVNNKVELMLEDPTMKRLLTKGIVAPNAVLLKDLSVSIVSEDSFNAEDVDYEENFHDETEELYEETALLSTDKRLSPVSPTLLRDHTGKAIHELKTYGHAGRSLEQIRTEQIRRAYAKRSHLIEGTFEYVKGASFMALDYIGLRYERLSEEVDLKLNKSRMSLFEL